MVPSREEEMVMIQEDQAGEPWSSYVDLLYIQEGGSFKAPHETQKP